MIVGGDIANNATVSSSTMAIGVAFGHVLCTKALFLRKQGLRSSIYVLLH